MEVTCSRSLKDRFCLLVPMQSFSTKTTRTSPRIAQETNILHTHREGQQMFDESMSDYMIENGQLFFFFNL